MTRSTRTAASGTMSLARKSRLLLGIAALALCLSLQSCFTAGLWSSGMHGREKAYLTPLSLTLDLVTLPVQLAWLDRGHHGHHHRTCR